MSLVLCSGPAFLPPSVLNIVPNIFAHVVYIAIAKSTTQIFIIFIIINTIINIIINLYLH